MIKEGNDPEIVDELPAYTSATLETQEQIARDRRHLYEGDNPPDKSTDLIEGFECYVQCDYDGTGVAEWRKVVVAGLSSKRALLSNEEWGDDLPFSDIVPDPVPHRWRGRSLFDSLEDIQKIKTVVWRQMLDNLYETNVPFMKVLENQVVNPNVLQDREIGTVAVVRDPNAITFDAVPFTADKSIPILELLNQTAEIRTGASKSSVALDPEALQEQTATAVTAMQAAASTKVEEYARNIAEHGGLRRIFSKILKLIVKHQDRARTVRLRDEWTEVDPRSWNAEMDVTINVGLGSGSRERDLTILTGIAMKQEQVLLQLGPVSDVLTIADLFKTYRLMVEAGGVKPADQFFPEIKPEVLQQMKQAAAQRQDPKLQIEQMRLQGQAQIEQMKGQMDQQAEAHKAQIAAVEEQNKHQRELAKAASEAQLQQVQFERQAQVEERQAQADMAVQQAKFQSERELAVMKFNFDREMRLLEFKLEQQKAAWEAQARMAEAHQNAAIKQADAEQNRYNKQADAEQNREIKQASADQDAEIAAAKSDADE